MRFLRACLCGIVAGAVVVAGAVGGATSFWSDDGVRVCVSEAYREGRGVLPDGAGGAWVAMAGSNPRVQRIDATGNRLLGDDGVALSAQTTEWVDHLAIVPDAAGGVIAGWIEKRTGWQARVFVQRLDEQGNRLWDAGGGDLDGIVLTTADYWHASNYLRMVPDGSGGAVLAWGWEGLTLRVQRVNSSGVPQWTEHGNTLATSRWALWDMGMVPDGTGGAIIAWIDRPEFGGDAIVYATRVDGTGARPVGWPAPGTVLCSAPGARTRLTIASDGAGGAFVLWSDHRTAADDPPLYGHRVRADGVLAWGLHEGLLLAARTSTDARYAAPVVPDGAGGFVAAWQVGSGWGNDTQLLAQRFGANGDATWNGGTPVALCDGTSSQGSMALAATGDGGAIAAWLDARGLPASPTYPTIRAQRLVADGTLAWGSSADGLVVPGPAKEAADEPMPVADGFGGAIAVWRAQSGSEQWDLYGQRVTGGEDPGPDVISQFILVKKVTCSPNERKPLRSRITLSAALDTGGTPAILAGPAKLTLGSLSVDLGPLVPDRKGVLRIRDGDLDLAIVPSPVGSSRCSLTLTLTEEAVLGLATEGAMSVGFGCGDVEATGSCVLRNGRYTTGGPLPHSAILPSKAKAILRGPGKDSLTAAFVFAPNPLVTELGAVEFAFGNGYRVTVPDGSFTRKGSVFRFRGTAGALPSVTLDFRRGLATVAATKLDLGAFPEGPQTVRLTVGPVGESVTTDVRMVRTGAALRY